MEIIWYTIKYKNGALERTEYYPTALQSVLRQIKLRKSGVAFTKSKKVIKV